MLSLVSYPERGIGGNNQYRGNCSPKLIEDIIEQYQIRNLNDYMVGSGTTEDVCRAKGVETKCYDLNRGFDLMEMDIPERPENIFFHPPYHDIIVYSDEMYKADNIIDKYGFDPRINDLSRCPSWEDFVSKLSYTMCKQFASLEKGGRMFTLMGDIKKNRELLSMICSVPKIGTMEQIIIKAQHNCMSYKNKYSGRFVPIVHEYLLVLRKDSATIYPITTTRTHLFDMRDSQSTTWRDVVAAILEDSGQEMLLSAIYLKLENHKKTENNVNWKAKVRQTLQIYPDFCSEKRGVWKMSKKKQCRN